MRTSKINPISIPAAEQPPNRIRKILIPFPRVFGDKIFSIVILWDIKFEISVPLSTTDLVFIRNCIGQLWKYPVVRNWIVVDSSTF